MSKRPPRQNVKDANPPAAFQDKASALPASRERMRELLLESSSVQSNVRGQEIEIQLGHFCNNRCVFCASGQLTEQGLAQPVPEDQIIRALEEAAGAGVRRVTFLGGEPTVQESLLPALRRAVELDFDDVVIFTNGVRTGDARYVEEIAKIGRFSWRFSIQGGNEKAHDTAVGRPGAFSRLVAGLTYLREAGHPVSANMCVTTHAMESLVLLPDLLLSHDITQMCIDMVRPVSVGDRSDAWMVSMLPRFSELAPHLDEMLQEFERRDPTFDINITHLPFCQLPQWGHKISHGGAPTLTFTADLNKEQGLVDKYDFQAHDRKLLPQCEECVFETRCTGIPHEYERIYGSAEIKALSREELARVDKRQNNFPLLIEPQLAGISKASPPTSWTLLDMEQEHRQRFVAIHWLYENNLRLSFRVMPPQLNAASGWFEALSTETYTVAFRSERNECGDAQVEMIAWFLATLNEYMTGIRDQPLTATEIMDRLRGFHRGARWMERALRTLHETKYLDRWSIANIERLGARAILNAEHREYGPLKVEISQGVAPDLPPLTFKIVEGLEIPTPALDAVSQALGALLRDPGK